MCVLFWLWYWTYAVAVSFFSRFVGFLAPAGRSHGTAATNHVHVKLERMEPADYFRAPGICKNAMCRDLNATVGDKKPHSNVHEKAYQRDYAHRLIAERLLTQEVVNIYVFDDWLQRIGAENEELFIEEVLERYDPARIRIWSPNMKADVIERMAAVAMNVHHPWLTAGCGCACSFNAMWADHIRAAGGLDVVAAAPPVHTHFCRCLFAPTPCFSPLSFWLCRAGLRSRLPTASERSRMARVG